MNRKKILNIAPDRTKNNSAATVKMVKDLETKLSPHTKNNAYREIFEEFYDLRTVPTIVTAHIFCACQGSRVRRETNVQNAGHADWFCLL